MSKSLRQQLEDEKKAFLEEGLAKLQNQELEESSGKLIMDLMESGPEKTLISFAKEWIKKFPTHEVAPRLAGKWFSKFESNEALYLSTSYVKTYPDLQALVMIVRAAGELPRFPKKLFDAIEKRFEKEPTHKVWGSLQASERPNEQIDKLLNKWILSNMSDADIVGEMSSIALLTTSEEVLDRVIKWTELNQDKTKYIWLVTCHLLRGTSAAHNQLAPRIIKLVRDWLKKNQNYENAGRIYGDLVQQTLDEVDIEDAKSWFNKNLQSISAPALLAGVFNATRMRGDEQDEQLVNSAKMLLKSLPIKDRSPYLVNALFRAVPDQETLQIAKEAVHSGLYDELLTDLLKTNPDESIISVAVKQLEEVKGFPAEPQLIVSILRADQENKVAAKAAQSWLKRNSEHEMAGKIKSALRS